MATKSAPKVNAPIEEHKKHAEDFLAKDKYKKPKPGADPKSDVANP